MHDTAPHLVTAHLPDGRLLIAHLDPATPDQHSPLRQALRAHHITETPSAGGDPGESSPDKP